MPPDRRQPFMQSLGWVSTLENMGWALVVCGRAFAAVHRDRHGIYIRLQRPAQLDLAAIRELKARSNAWRVFVEPNHTVELCDLAGRRSLLRFDKEAPQRYVEPLVDAGWSEAAHRIGPSKSRVIRLASDAEAQLAGFSASTRRNLRYALKRYDVAYSVASFEMLDSATIADVGTLYRTVVAEHAHLEDEWDFRSALKRCFGPSGDLVLAHREGTLLGAAYLLRHDRIATYYAAFTSRESRRQNVPTGLVWTAMRHAADRGCDRFDFYGVFDERRPEATATYRGFTEFKQRFGGEDVYYPPSFDA